MNGGGVDLARQREVARTCAVTKHNQLRHPGRGQVQAAQSEHERDQLSRLASYLTGAWRQRTSASDCTRMIAARPELWFDAVRVI